MRQLMRQVLRLLEINLTEKNTAHAQDTSITHTGILFAGNKTAGAE